MKSRITGGPTKELFKAKVLNKYSVNYYQCLDTGFIQTEDPYWIEEAYSSAITKLDVGLLSRNQILCEETARVILKHYNYKGKFLDYAGGYGVFTRMMRDKGFDFYHTDRYCANIFAEYFELAPESNTRFDLVTAFEVFEHMTNPIIEIQSILKFSDNLLFSTELQPNAEMKSIDDWWYFIPETGQHISLHTVKSLEFIANKLGYRFYTNGKTLHLFTKTTLSVDPFRGERLPFFIRKMQKIVNNYLKKRCVYPESLLQSDWELIKRKL